MVGKLVLRSSAGVHGPKGNFTVLYDGEGELDFGLVKHHIYYHGKGIDDIRSQINEPHRGKTNNEVSEQVRHKPACTSTEKS